jgi:tricorn protease
MMRYPTVSESQIAFVYANNIWVVPRSGGTAKPVAAPPGTSALPRFSPDGKTLAFVGNYDGNRDIYTIAVGGGIPQRVTHHPGAETLAGWVGSDQLLFFTAGAVSMARQTQMYTVPAAGGLPTKLPVPYGAFGSISADGQWLAYTPHSTDNRTWKRYRGGMATDVWVVNLRDLTSRKVTDWEGTDTLPMWGNGPASKTLYYLSDAGEEHRLNIWSVGLDGSERKQLTKFAEDDVRWPSMGPGEGKGSRGEIVFQLGSKLMLLSLDSKETRAVNVTIPGARPKIRPRTVDASENIGAWGLSPSGKRVLLVGRGDIWSVPVKEGVTRNLTRTGGVFERDAAWSPDGKWIAYFSDQSGEYELWLRASDAKAVAEEEKKEGAEGDASKESKDPKPAAENAPAGPTLRQPVKLTDLGAGFRYNPTWSPDSKRIAFTDKAGKLMIATLKWEGSSPSAEIRGVDQNPQGQPEFSWSHDSSWIAYTRADEASEHECVWMYKVGSGEKTRVTSPMFDAGSPAFDRKGEFFYFRSSSKFTSPRYADGDSTFIYSGTQQLMMATLRDDVKNPLAVKSDEEDLKKEGAKPAERPGAAEKKDDAKPNGEKKPDAPKKDAAPKKDLKIDLEGFERRAMLLPVAAGNFGGLVVSDDGKLVYVRRGSRGEDDKPGIKLFDPKGEKKEEETVLDGAGAFDLAAGGKKLITRIAGKFKVLDAAPGGGKAQDVGTSGMKLEVDPREEWRQIFSDAWREQRDYFYVENMHGVDWPAMRIHYGAMIEDAASREDVQYIIGELISELNIGHAYVQSPGDVGDQGPSVPVGMLCCDYELVGKAGDPGSAYRFRTIFEGASWDADARSPLSTAVDAQGKTAHVKPGEFLLAVNGTPIDTREDPYAPFVGLADKTTTLTINDKPMLEGAREILVKPVGAGGDTAIRYRAWIERNRAYVERTSGGAVGYIHVPDTGVNGQNELFRQFFGQKGRQALIIDERWNGGGQIPNRFIELLNRPATNAWALRDSQDWIWPRDAHNGPKCMLINGLAGSGGDMFPWLFKHNKVGKVIGERTWGGLVGISGNPEFIDGGSMTVPKFGFYKLDGTWGVEGHGVDPDMPVLDDPAMMMDGAGPDGPHASIVGGKGGGDPQLDAAVKEMLAEVKEHPFVKPTRPPSPDRKGMGVPEKDR